MSTDADGKKRSRMAEDEDQRAERLLKNKVRMQHQREEGRVLNTLADEFDLKKPLPFRSFVSTATDPEVIQRERKAWNDASNPIVRAIRAALPGNFL